MVLRRVSAHRLRRSAKYRRLRSIYFAQHPLCEICESRGRIEMAVEVHHVQGIAKRPDLAFERGNLQSLCVRCHAYETRVERGGKRGCDENGNLS